MKASLVLVAALAAAVLGASLEKEWHEFRNKHERRYATVAEESLRLGIFKANLARIQELQALGTDAKFEVNQFADLSAEEFQAQFLTLNTTEHHAWIQGLAEAKADDTRVEAPIVDWLHGPIKAVSSVKDQGQCGSCWAFSAAGALEACAMLNHCNNVPVDASAQQFVDCCTAGGSNGCNSGYSDLCLNWATQRNIATWASYPYIAQKGVCRTSGFVVAVGAGVCRFLKIAATETATANALGDAPVSIALAGDVLQFYTSGIISGIYCTLFPNVNHAVVLVANNGPVYTVKNSWGTSWGEAGYFRMVTGVNCLRMASDSSQALHM
jgi:hypothetical protein